MANPFPQIPFQTQLDFLWSELEGPEKKTLEAFQSGGYITPQDYAEAFEKLFERSKGSALDKRKQYALEVFKGMEDPLNPQGLSQNAAIAYNYLLNKGLNPPQASGIVGNLMAESFGSIDPAAYNPSGGGQGALGIAQWRGPRLESLLKFAGMNGEKPMVQSTFGSGVPTAGTIFPQQQKKQGLQGLLQQFMQPNQTTGLTGPENFAQALDALILPEARMGEQIRARGAQRLQSQSRNKTIETLKQRAAQGDNLAKMVLQGLESGAYDAKTAMSLYMGKMLETPKDDRTSMIKNYEYWLSKGKSQEEAEALSKTQPLVDMSTTDKGLQEWDIDFTKSVFSDASNADKQLSTVRRQIELSQNPDFTAGAGSELIQTGKALLKRFGVDADVSSNEEFVALMRQQVLDRLGGSLGVGISASDVEYLDAMQANPNMDARTIRNMLLATEAILVRQQEIADFARDYMKANNLRTLSQIDFSLAVREHFANKPIFGE